MKQCFAVKEKHPVLPDRVVHVSESVAQAEHVCQVKNGELAERETRLKYILRLKNLEAQEKSAPVTAEPVVAAKVTSAVKPKAKKAKG